MVEQELQQRIDAIPGIRWLRIVSVDGISHPVYRFDAGNINRDTPLYREESRYAAMTADSLSLSERIAQELLPGESTFTVIAGKQSIYFLLPVGDGAEWVISFVVKGQPAIDPIIQYFKDRDYLASLVPLL